MEDKTLEKNICAICGGPADLLFSAADYVSGETFGIYQCGRCGLVATLPAPLESDFSRYYPSSYYGQRKLLVDRMVNYSRWRKVKRGKADGSILDVGCGDGGFLLLLAGKGWRVAGTEMAQVGSHARPAPDFICRGQLPDCAFAAESFDIATMWHSFEHLAKPLVYLKEISRLLRPDGKLLLELPNFASWQASVFKNNWFHLDAPRHIFHYDEDSLGALLKQAGFKIAKISHDSLLYSAFGFIQSCLNAVCRRKNLLFDIINGKISAALLARDYPDALLTFLLVWPLLPISFIIFCLEKIFKKGPVLTVWAARQK